MSDKPKSTGYPICKLCGEAHPMGGPHSWDKPTPAIAKRAEGAKAAKAAIKSSAGERGSSPDRARAADATATPAPISKKRLREIATIPDSAIDTSDIPEVTPEQMAKATLKRPRGRPKKGEGFDKKAYQRELMRKRRAEKAGK